MTQYIRAAKAFPATTSAVVNAASPPPTDLRNLTARMRSMMTFGRGMTQPGSMRTNTPTSTGAATRSLLMLDDMYAAVIAAGVDLSDTLYNSSAPEPGSAYSVISEMVTAAQNYGWCRQVVLCFGDSLEDGATGGGAFPDLLLPENQPWSFGCDTPGLASQFYIPTTTALAPNVIFNVRTHERSRIVYKFANGGWRFANQPPPASYTQGSPWLDNVEQAAKIPIWPHQQVVAYIEIGSNDVDYYTGLFAVPASAGSGYASKGSPNFFDDCLVPFIAALRARYPGIIIIWQTPIARDSTSAAGSDNAKFAEISAYGVANKALYGIDIGLDTRQIPAYDCRNPSVTLNQAVYQPDKTHLVAEGYAIKRPYKRAVYDKALGFTPDPEVASAIF